MEYQLTVIISLCIFLALDVLIFVNSFRNGRSTGTQKVFSWFAFMVALQQLFAVFTRLAEPEFNRFGAPFTYFAYIGALVFMTFSSYYCYSYLRQVILGSRSKSNLVNFLTFLPVIVTIVTCFVSPLTHWVFYADENGAYQRGTMFFIQMVCPYVYIALCFILALSRRSEVDSVRRRRMLRFFFVYMIPSLIGVAIQMFVVKGGYSATGVSIGMLMLYLEIYMEDINENKRLKSIEPLNIQLQQANEEQKTRLEEISRLNKMLEDRMGLIQTMSRVYFVSFYANLIDDSFLEISNTDFVKKYVGSSGTASEALNVFCEKMVLPEFTGTLKEFVDTSTLNERMKNKQFITCDYLGNVAGWCQLYFIAGDRAEDGTLKTVFLAARTIHDEKEREFAQNRELDNARIAAEAASAAKTVFLNNMSHDIRTPLNAILGFSNLMAKEKNNPEAVDGYLKKIINSGEYLLSIINNVLDMARIESGKVSVENSFIDFREGEKGIGTYIRDLAESTGHGFSMDIDINHRFVMADGAKVKQILMNLVSNAVKYTPAGGSIQLQFKELPCDIPGTGRFRMKVADTGIGMSQEFLEHIFDSFSRERNTTDSRIIGTGLGMSIVKRLVDLLGGTIEVESEKGKGSTFTVTFDFELAEVPEADVKDAENKSHSPVDFAGKRILLAEDNELNAEIATAVLEDQGFIVEHAENGMEGTRMLSEAPEGYYNLILMDIQMPVMNGYEAAKAIRALPKGADIPIIALSANAFAEDKAASMAVGMNEHIAKPINVAELTAALSRLL